MAKPIAPALTPPPIPRPQSTMAHGEFKAASDAEFIWQELNHNEKIAWANWAESLTDWHVAQLQEAFVLKLAEIPGLDNVAVINAALDARFIGNGVVLNPIDHEARTHLKAITGVIRSTTSSNNATRDFYPGQNLGTNADVWVHFPMTTNSGNNLIIDFKCDINSGLNGSLETFVATATLQTNPIALRSQSDISRFKCQTISGTDYLSVKFISTTFARVSIDVTTTSWGTEYSQTLVFGVPIYSLSETLS